jgi:hypothetical protein
LPRRRAAAILVAAEYWLNVMQRAAMQRRKIDGREILLEFHQVGDYIKVSAIDVDTNIEASIVGSPRSSKQQLTRIAVQKLEYVLKKRRQEGKAKPDRGIKV